MRVEGEWRPEENRKEERLARFKVALNDIRHILTTYTKLCPAEALETIRKIVFDKKLK